MKNSFLLTVLKIGKAVLKAGATVIKFSFKIIMAVFLDKTRDKEIQEFKKWQDDRDEYRRSINRNKSL